jgi:ABC-type multidrug transport system ATPase subunit
MDEAESLCHKIGIQINGQFVCMGSPQHLKMKYGSGYRIVVDVSNHSVPIAKMVQERFPNSVKLETKNENQLVF